MHMSQSTRRKPEEKLYTILNTLKYVHIVYGECSSVGVVVVVVGWGGAGTWNADDLASTFPIKNIYFKSRFALIERSSAYVHDTF